MKFTGRTQFEWRDRQTDTGQTLCMGEIAIGFAYPAEKIGAIGVVYRWGAYATVLEGEAATLEDAKAALLNALGITEDEEVAG